MSIHVNNLEFNSYYDTERINKGVCQILNNNVSSELNSTMNYLSFLGEKEEKGYEDLLYSLSKDVEFTEMFSEFKARCKIFLPFASLGNEIKIEILIKSFFIIKTQKDQVIEEYWRVKTQSEEKQKVLVSNQIEKYKNEAYILKCERDELKIQINRLKTKKDGKEKDKDKTISKCEKYKEKVTELEKLLIKSDNERKEVESKFKRDFFVANINYEKVIKQYDELFLNFKDLEEEFEISKKQTEDFKIKCENLNQQVLELTEININLQRIKSSSNNNTNLFSSHISEGGIALDKLMMTELNVHDISNDKPTEATLTVRVGISPLKGKIQNSHSKQNKTPHSHFNIKNKEEEDNTGKKIFKEEIFVMHMKSKDPNRISYLISGEEENENFGSEHNEIDYGNDREDDIAMNKIIKNKIDTIHNYESHVSVDVSEIGSENISMKSYNNSFVNSEFISNNTEPFSELQSNLNSMYCDNTRSEYESANYDTLRKFHPKKLDDSLYLYNSNNIKY